MLDFRISWPIRVALSLVCLLIAVELIHLFSDRIDIHPTNWLSISTSHKPQPSLPSATPTSSPEPHPQDDACGAFEASDNIVVAVKTGATEAGTKVPALLPTSLLCATNVHIFSDMAQTIGAHQVHDALKDVADDVKNDNPDFDIYREQQKLQDPQKIVDALGGMMTPGTSDLAAWTLDKYKNIHIAEQVWELQPERDWYLFIDADTYVLWATMVAWTKELDPTEVLYIGAKATLDGFFFAHGGSGYLLSNAAMRRIVVENKGTAARWDHRAREVCCGDYLLAMAIEEYGIRLMNVSPVMDGHRPDEIPYDRNRWCQYLATLHHIGPEDFTHLAAFEAQRQDKSRAIRYLDIYYHFVAAAIPTERGDWDNWTQGEQGLIYAYSIDDCKEACKQDRQCTQTLWDGKQCKVEVDRVTLGRPRNATAENAWYSTWDLDRIRKWVAQQKECDNGFPGVKSGK